MQDPGGVGLVFVHTQDDWTTYLQIDRFVADGPAERSGMLVAGDRLVAINGVEIGTRTPGQAPQLPGPHGTPVALTFLRPVGGRAFYEGCEVDQILVHLTRHRDFFPDKVVMAPVEANDDTSHLPAHLHAKSDESESLRESEVARLEAQRHSQRAHEHDKLVDEVLESILTPDRPNAYGKDRARLLLTAHDPRRLGPLLQHTERSGIVGPSRDAVLRQELNERKERLKFLEEQLLREREEAIGLKNSYEGKIRALVDSQNAGASHISQLRQEIDKQAQELEAVREGGMESEKLRRAKEVLESEKERGAANRVQTEGIIKAMRENLSQTRAEQKAITGELRKAQEGMLNLTLQQEEQERVRKTEESTKEITKRTLLSEELTRKKAEALAREIIRLRGELKRAGENSRDDEQVMMREISKLREENKVLRDCHLSTRMEPPSIGLSPERSRGRRQGTTFGIF